MSRRRARAAQLGGLLLTAATTTVITAAPAYALNDELSPQEGADLYSGITTTQGLLLFVLVPALILFVTAALVWLPGMITGNRYRPQRGWAAAPVWFAGPPDPVKAVETADPNSGVRGGASGSW
ncbi:MAG: hypothetical protein M3P46_02865 [Actinomycetota bacterium]|nr:hypothetical protein [Actinomycetota bacterium]